MMEDGLMSISDHDQAMSSLEGKKRKTSDSVIELDPLSILTGPYRMRAPKSFDLTNCTKQDLLDFFEDSYSLSESLFTALRTEDAFYMCPDRLRLPLIFYYAHTASVYVNKLLQAEFLQSRVNSHFETLFETGVNENKWDDVENNRMGGSFVWPPLKEVVEFRRQVRELVRERIFHTSLQLPITQDSPWWGLLMVMDHDAVHTETSSVLIRQLPIQQVRPVEGWRKGPITSGEPVEQNPMIPVSAKTVKFGKPRDFPTFGWDIDYCEIYMRVPKFEASKYLITNKEFLEFVDCGGYSNKEVWTKEGWLWKETCQPNHPLFWICSKGCKSGCGGSLQDYSHCIPHDSDCSKKHYDGSHIPQGKDKFRFRTMCEEIEMPWDWPVEVNFHEAKAYCNWLGADYRLLTEAEYHAIRDFPPVESLDINLDFITDPLLNQKFNINLNFMTSTPVNLFSSNKMGFHDVMGNVWCLLEDHMNGLPGWESHMLYDDYSRTYFDSKHNVLLGGSWATNGYGASRFIRWWFRRHFHQHAGFRVTRTVDKSQNLPVRYVKPVENIEDVEIPLYVKDVDKLWTDPKNDQFQQETAESLILRLSHEYGDFEGRNFYKDLSDLCKQLVDKYKVSSLRMEVEVGSGCGRVSFEIARQFKEVVGVDYCNNYIGASYSVLKKGNLELIQPIIGSALDGKTTVQNTISNIHNEGNFNSITFKQFTWLPNELSGFDLVLHQLVDRAVNKKSWCLRLWELIHDKGLVVFTSSEILNLATIQQLVGSKLRCLETHCIPFNGPVNAMVTVWCRA